MYAVREVQYALIRFFGGRIYGDFKLKKPLGLYKYISAL